MASEPESALAIDFKVLPHLRGYTEELHRYANLMKQAHPRGIYVVELLLNRPQAPDGFLEAICRFVRDGIDILTGVKVAARLGRSPQAFLDEVAVQSSSLLHFFAKQIKGSGAPRKLTPTSLARPPHAIEVLLWENSSYR